jgi:hypothetical protein
VNGLIVTAIAAVGAWIALQQMYIARVKLQHDLFDRRFKVFDAARKFLVLIVRQGKPTEDQISEYTWGVIDATFLLDKATDDYLANLRKEAVKMRTIRAVYDPMPVGEERTRLVHKEGELFTWMNAQLDGPLVEKFAPFLRLDLKTPQAKLWDAVRKKVSAYWKDPGNFRSPGQ